MMFSLSFVEGSVSAERGPNPLAELDRGGPNPLADCTRTLRMIFALSFVKGSESAERGPNPLADLDRGGHGTWRRMKRSNIERKRTNKKGRPVLVNKSLNSKESKRR